MMLVRQPLELAGLLADFGLVRVVLDDCITDLTGLWILAFGAAHVVTCVNARSRWRVGFAFVSAIGSCPGRTIAADNCGLDCSAGGPYGSELYSPWITPEWKREQRS